MTDENEFWIDHMVEKHECFHCSCRTETIDVDGQTLVLLVPQWSAKFEVVEAHKTESKVFLILRDLETAGWDDNLGIVAIAVRQEDDRYAVVFWHATYPYIWEHL